MFSRQFDHEPQQDDEASEVSSDAPDYAFEGFNIEFSDKVALILAATPGTASTRE